MCTSDKKAIKNCIGHICATIFLAFFGAVYEKFSHEVYSYYMIYAFAIPLLFGALPFGIAALKNITPDRITVNLWNSAIATFSVGSIFKGVLEIYGTTNRLIIVYPIVGIILTVAAGVFIISQLSKQ
ncbi:MAG: hypothetical protein V3G42_10245 [Oscillospiraceae bacterium]